MLNVRNLSELLRKNVDSKLFPRMFLMSPNGTLLAYSTPVDIKELRDQAALVSMAWKDHETALRQKGGEGGGSDMSNAGSSATKTPLETLTIEFERNNLIARAIQPNLLLVLVGGVPPGNDSTFKMTPETTGDSRYPHEEIPVATSRPPEDEAGPSEETSTRGTESSGLLGTSIPESHMSQLEKDVKIGLLHIQRKKLDAMTRFLRNEFVSRGFTMPDDISFT